MEQTALDWFLAQQSALQLQETTLSASAIISSHNVFDANSIANNTNKRTGSGSDASNGSNDGNNADPDPESQPKKKERAKPGRKLANDEPANKRVAQSREAQRAFRERRANHVKELEAKVDDLTKIVEAKGPTPVEIALTEKVTALETENSILRQMTFNFDFAKQPTLGLPILGATVNSMINTLSNSGPLMFNPTGSSSFGSGNMANLFTTTGPNLTQSDLLKRQKVLETASDDSLTRLLSRSLPDTTPLLTQSVSNDSPLLFQASQPSKSNVNFTSIRTETASNNETANDFDLLQSLLDDENNEQSQIVKRTPPILDNSCPFGKDAFDKMIAIPSLANSEALVDELCTAFTGNAEAFIGTQYPDIMPQELIEVVRLKKKVLEVCTEEDGKKFYEVLMDGKQKQYEKMTGQLGPNASLLGPCI
ncbi:DNA-binding transcription factor yap1 [Physocladia obscura]|uniref:DNA-binding transcription factor yap1 n=1 Tax=Physocladia obscura TaxID=109957 RepID=A0AAD5T8R1_9FUNG|nr:DNA-binding transcription factor yap1 [Physocladia obscura]